MADGSVIRMEELLLLPASPILSSRSRSIRLDKRTASEDRERMKRGNYLEASL